MFGFDLCAALLLFAANGGGGFLVLGNLPGAEYSNRDGGNPTRPRQPEFFARGIGEALAALGAIREVRSISEAAECANQFHKPDRIKSRIIMPSAMRYQPKT